MLRLDAEKVSVTRGGHQILRDINLSFQGGELIALLGPSGSGKSTLLKALSGFNPGDGQVFLGDQELYEEFEVLKTKLGYVPQEDLVHQTLSVESIIDYSAQLRLPADIPEALRRAKVRAVMAALELEGSADTKVKSLSGGQRKRVSVAVELLAEPPVLFLDEPTSGLDPALEESSMKLFRQLTNKNRLTFVTTHVLTSLQSVDLVVFLNQGRLVYVGPPTEASSFFGVDHIISVYKCLTAEAATEQQGRFLESAYFQRYITNRLLAPRAPFLENKKETASSEPAFSTPRNHELEQNSSQQDVGLEQSVSERNVDPAEVLRKMKEARGKE